MHPAPHFVNPNEQHELEDFFLDAVATAKSVLGWPRLLATLSANAHNDGLTDLAFLLRDCADVLESGSDATIQDRTEDWRHGT